MLFASDLGPAKSTRELVAMVELFIKRYFLLDNPFEYRLDRELTQDRRWRALVFRTAQRECS